MKSKTQLPDSLSNKLITEKHFVSQWTHEGREGDTDKREMD